MKRTLENITGLLESEGCTWHDIVRTSCYLRDIDRDYEAFNEERTAFFKAQGLDPLPASTGIQAKLCRPELLVEIEAIAMFRTEQGTSRPGVVAMRRGLLVASMFLCVAVIALATAARGQGQGASVPSASRGTYVSVGRIRPLRLAIAM